MRISHLFGPQLERILREQKQSGRESWFRERQAALRLGGPSMLARSKRPDPNGSLRAMACFGLVGGELCGCRSPTCDTCTSDGTSVSSCGCATPWCEVCRSQVGKALPIKKPAALEWFGPEDWRDIQIRPNWGSLLGLGELVALTRYDIHSHNFCASESDWEAARDHYATTGNYLAASENETEARIDRLYGLKPYGIDLMAISGQYDPDDGGIDGYGLEDVVNHAWNKYPTYFLPFVRGFEQEGDGLLDATAPAYVESWLSAGFMGVGELFPHAYGKDFDDAHFPGATDALIAIFDVARRYSVPVCVHWQIGAVNGPTTLNPTPSTAAENFDHLLEILDYFECFIWSGDFRLILAHCGAGPAPNDLSAAQKADYAARLDTLLTGYPGVYFDIAGMAGVAADICGSSGEPNDIGKIVLDRMAIYPTRFMVGIDAKTRTDSEASDYADSIAVYDLFLSSSYSTLSAAERSWIRGNNARIVLG